MAAGLKYEEARVEVAWVEVSIRVPTVGLHGEDHMLPLWGLQPTIFCEFLA